ncbi:hypothetical protein [Enterovibrio norvegicus]|uniref:EamA domain-containing protein n=1 Tax=Enterovibrio norvegicus TaxID=188144 RepID=A0A2N7L5L1_9GAMM|nr:hypothetical protein [Enterovibrio norvegicus]PML80847.1 hypothetical protein BCT69_09385 [Enterovibrio norvegicus]PMN67377.1 hypothetical protein BCT27_05410 [Enterovibrio norvegicus]PMN88926.1 hypothetical protein BCT23_05335 [Enterovibrio norvegicus]
MITKLLIFLFYIASSSFGLVFIKKSTGLFSFLFMAGNVLYIVGYIIWVSVILKMLPLSTAFPLASAGLLIASQIAGKLVLDEKVDIYNLVGCGFIILGFIIIFIKGDFQ